MSDTWTSKIGYMLTEVFNWKPDSWAVKDRPDILQYLEYHCTCTNFEILKVKNFL